VTAVSSEIWGGLSREPLPWLVVTLVAHQSARALYRRSGWSPLAHPVLISVVLIGGALRLTDTPYQTYFDGAQFVHFLLGSAIVALAIPLYAELGRLKAMLVPLAITVLVGSTTAIASAVSIGWLFGASPETVLSLAPKSVTMPIAMGAAEKLGGLPSLTALTVTITGISGAIMARQLLQLLKIYDAATRGFAVGLTAHAIGTAQMLEESPTAGAFAALAMGLNGVVTVILLSLMTPLLTRH
jgi:predicted murein hydrolase (TIGR00659 family)